MAYELLIDPAGYDTTPQEFATCIAPELLFSQIFTGTPQFYAGSTFTVEEILEFYVTIQDDTLIDKDFIWYPPKLYLGTWSLFSQLSGFGTNPENRGFLEDTITQVTRYSTYTIQGNADVPIAVHEQSAIDGCNFQLISAEIGIPPISIEGSQLFDPIAAFKSRNTLQRVPLIDQPFNRKIKYVGIATRPGCLCTGILYKARIINAISVDLPPFPLTTCFYAPPNLCNNAFDDFVQIGETYPFFGSQTYYKTEAEVIAAVYQKQELGFSSYELLQYTCPLEPFTVYSYYRMIQG